MNDENTKFLIEKYPKMFPSRKFKWNGNEEERAFHFECSDGWFALIDVLCAEIQNEADHRQEQLNYKKEKGETVNDEEYEELQPVAMQVKEKYGGLRFYTYGGNDQIRGMITLAESMSYKICESCGNPGTLLSKGWWRTLCDPCRADDERKKQEWEENYKRSLEEMKAKNVKV